MGGGGAKFMKILISYMFQFDFIICGDFILFFW